MKSFTTLVFIASIALASAQVTYINGTFHCAIADAAYCASDSLSTNIIIRCNGHIGYPGNCNDNLDGEFPYGLSYSPCFQTSDVSGDAACTKNCIIYGASGNYNGSSTVLPNCVPEATSTSSVSSASSASSPIRPTTSSSVSMSPIGYSNTSASTPCDCTHHSKPTTYYTPTLITLTTASGSASSGSPPKPSTNGTTITSMQSTGGSATNVPVGPTKTTGPPKFTGAAVANQACAGLAAIGVMLAFFL